MPTRPPGRTPVVSCVLVTADRPAWVATATRHYARQTVADRELVVVDTGRTPLPREVLPTGTTVVRAPGAPVGEARNLGVRNAAGRFVAHWDDDDWYGCDRLAEQLSLLTGRDGDVTGVSTLLVYRLAEGDAWRYRPAADDLPFLAGTSLCYRRELALAVPLPTENVGEDAAWLAALRGTSARVVASSDDHWLVALQHGSNTAARRLSDPRWARADVETVAHRIGAAMSGDVRPSGSQAPAEPSRVPAASPGTRQRRRSQGVPASRPVSRPPAGHP